MTKLFYDDEFAAIRDVIEAGKGYKATAMHLWPAMKAESAYARLKVCCNEHGDQHLRFGEIVRAMQFNDRFDVLFYLCDETGHDRPQRRAVADVQAELMREFNRSVERLAAIQTALQQRSCSIELKSVRVGA
jgi:hypothetical protein